MEQNCENCRPAFMVENLTKEVADLKSELEKVKGQQQKLDNEQTGLKITLQTYGDRFTKIEVGIDSIVAKLGGISTSLLTIQTTEKIKSDMSAAAVKTDVNVSKTNISNNSKLLTKLVGDNSKMLYLVIFVLSVVLLFSLGMKAADIAQILK